jgi:hypothetical protein
VTAPAAGRTGRHRPVCAQPADGAGDGHHGDRDHQDDQQGSDVDLVEVVGVEAGGNPGGHDGREGEPGRPGRGEQDPACQQRPSGAFLGDPLSELALQPLAADERSDDRSRAGQHRGGAETEGGAGRPAERRAGHGRASTVIMISAKAAMPHPATKPCTAAIAGVGVRPVHSAVSSCRGR